MTRPIYRRQWWASATIALVALAVHLAFFCALTLGTGTGKSAKPTPSDIANERLSNAIPRAVSTLILVDTTAISSGGGISIPPRSVRALQPKALAVIDLARLSAAMLDPAGDQDPQSPRATSIAAVDGPERAMLFGRYVNQIAQRINRAWVRPGIDGSQAFKCRAQIVQSRAGTVLEVTLVSCDSSPDWQQSLVNAIQAASPLPAPASTSVFTRSLVLDFTSAALPDGSPLRTASAGSRP